VASSNAPYRIYNIGNNRPVRLMDFIGVLEQCLGRKAVLDLLPMQPGDVPATFADTSELASLLGFAPRTDVREGVRRFVEWYRAYYQR
jgi:UDP-glucuronate 4-epimerase